MEPIQETLTFGQLLPVARERAWAAYADLAERLRWGAPEGAGIEYDTPGAVHDGGVERFRCGPAGALDLTGECVYHHVEEGRGFVMTGTVRGPGGTLLGVSLESWWLEPTDTGCRLDLVVQVTSLVGEGMLEGHREGNTATLARMAAHLDG